MRFYKDTFFYRVFGRTPREYRALFVCWALGHKIQISYPYNNFLSEPPKPFPYCARCGEKKGLAK